MHNTRLTPATAASLLKRSFAVRLKGFLRCNLALLLVGLAVVALPVVMQTPQPASAAVLTGFTQVEGGQMFTCALKLDGTVWCWGGNDYGMLGNSDQNRNRQWNPVQVYGLTDVTQISTGFRTICAVKTDGTVWCWGEGAYGTLGHGGNHLYYNRPVQTYNLTGVSKVSVGFRHACAVKTIGTVFCWGNNFSKQLGTGDTSDTNYPVAAAGITTAVEVTATYENTCVRLQDQSVRCWGGASGLGNGSSVASATAVQPTGLSGVSALSPTDGSTICAAKTNGTLWCWGNNASGQIGNGNTTNQTTPVQVSSITGVAGVSGSVDTHTCARKSDGTAWCWGYNGSNQVGDGTTVQRLTPTAVTGLTGVTQISAGEYYSCAVLQDTTIKCWGGGGEGVLGTGTDTQQISPVYVRSAPTVLSTPASVTATATASTAKSIDVSWGAVSNSTSYTVKMYDSSGATLLGTRDNITTASTTLTSATYASIADNTTYKVTVTAVGDGGDYTSSSASAQVSATTNAVAATPSITSQPVALNRTSGQSATFSVTATRSDAGTLSYQWLKDGADIPSATLSSYSINPLATTDAGSISVRVTNTVSGRVAVSTTSSAVALTVAGELSIATPTTGLSGTANSAFSLVIAGSGGRTSLTYALTGTLVSGLSFATSTGTISGTPTVAGSSTVSVRVTDANSATATTSNFTVAIGYASTTVSLALASSSPQYGVTNRITATTSRAGAVNFMLGGTTISGCGAVAAATTTATCDWVPTALGAASLSATFTPTSSTAYANSTASLSTTVGAQAITVTPTAGQSKLFGDADSGIAFSITSGALYGSDSLAGALSRAAGEDAGTYAITVGTLSNANYAITLASVNFTIRGAGTPIISSQPASANKTSGQSVTFSVTASSPDTGGLSYQWSKDGAAILSGTSASYTINTVATSDAGSFTVVVSNSINNGLSTSVASTTSTAATLAVASALTIATPVTGLNKTGFSAFSRAVPGAGGRAPLTYALTGTLASGLSLSASTGTISGTPTAGGAFTVSVTVTDANGATASTSNFTIYIYNALTIATPTTGLSGTASSSFSLAVTTAGGRAALTYALTGTLVSGLSFSTSTGTISGTPTVAGSSTVSVTVTDVNSAVASTSNFTIDISGALTIATPTTGLSGTAHSSFSLAVAGSGGRASLTYALTGTLVSGLSFATGTGTISGTPTATGSSTVSITVTDANGATATTSNFTFAIGYASTTVSLSLVSSARYQTTSRITATTSRAGSVNFMLGGTSIAGCEAVAATTTTATCDWVPASLGVAALSATFAPTASTYSSSTSSLSPTVVGRLITVTPTAGQSKVFGTTDPAIGYSITSGSLYGSDALTGALSRVPGDDVGTYSITGGTLSNGNYDITLVSVDFSITQANQSAVALSTTSGVYLTGLTLAASGGSGTGAYSFAVAATGTAGCSITSGVLNATSPGECTVVATRATSTNYLVASSAATTVTIGKATQSVVTLTSTSGTFNTNISLSATGGTGSGGYSYVVTDAGSAGCSLATSTSLRSSGAGTCTVTATRASDSNYEARSSAATTVSFARDSQNLLSVRDVAGDLDTGITLSVSGGSGTGALSYSVTSGTASCSVASGVVSARYAGSCLLTTTKAADTNYSQAQITNTLTFIKATQASLVVTSVSGTYGSPLTLITSGGSGSGTVSFLVSDAGTASCSVSGSVLSFTAAGTCRVTATRDADSVFDSRSSSVTTITIDKANQPALSTATTSGDLVTGIIVSVTGGAGTGALSTSVTTGTANCALAGGVVAARANGTCVLSISKLGDTNYNAASATVTLTFAKAVAARGTLGSPTSGTAGTGITLSFSGGSGTGAVTYSLVSPGTAGCSITNGVLNATTGGKCSVVITKQGDDTYADQTTTVEFTFASPPSAPQGQSEVAAVTTTTSTTTTVAPVVKKSKVTTTTTIEDESQEIQATTTTSPKSSMPIKQLVAPSLVNTPSAVGAATIGGKLAKATTTRVNNQLVFNAGGFTVTLAGVKADGTIIPLSSDGLLEVQRGDTFRLDATGFAPGSNVDIWMFSKSMLMANITVGADGLVKSSFKVPKSMSDGLHHLVMVGIDKAKAEAKFEMGLNVGAPVKQWWASRVLIVIPIAVAVFIGLWLPTTVRRRKRRQLV